MKKDSEKKKNQKENSKLIFEKKNTNTFNAKANSNLQKKSQELSPIALMKYRIEEMNRKLYEKRNQSKKTPKSTENRE